MPGYTTYRLKGSLSYKEKKKLQKIKSNKIYNKYIFYFRNIYLNEKKKEKKGEGRKGKEGGKGEFLLVTQPKCWCPQKKHSLKANPCILIFWYGRFGKCISHESSLSEGTNTHTSYKGLGKTPSSLIHVKTQAEDGHLCSLLTDAGYAASLSLDLIFSRPVIKCICSIQKPLSPRYSVTGT